MNRIAIAILVSLFAAGSAMADDTCKTKAVDKAGKPLAGAALTSFLKKCKQDACEPKAVSEDGEPLSGAAKASFMKKCDKKHAGLASGKDQPKIIRAGRLVAPLCAGWRTMSAADRHPATTAVFSLAHADLSFIGAIFGLRPPLRPRVLADAQHPPLVRSEVSSRSNSAKIRYTTFPLVFLVLRSHVQRDSPPVI